MSGVDSQLVDTSKNVLICHSCTSDLEGEYVTCQGFCNAVFHPKCCNTSLDLLTAVVTHRQTFWLCKSCSSLMLDLRHRRSVQCAFEAGQELSLSHHNRIVEQLKTEILSELKAEISSNFNKLISSNSLTPRSVGHGAGGSLNPASRRLFGNDRKPAPKKNPESTQTANGNLSSPTGGIVAETEGPLFWLYLSRVSRRVTVEQIIKLATERLGVTDLKVTRLVAKGRDVSRMKFISFKVGMDVSLKAKALSSSTWPEGLVVREFEDRSEKFWEPMNVQTSLPSTTPPSNRTLPPTTTPPPNPTPPKNSTPTSSEKVTPMSTTSSPDGAQSV